MRRSLLFVFSALLLSCAYFIGCSPGYVPTSPIESNQIQSAIGSEMQSSDSITGRYIFGYWNCTFDPDKNTIEFVPLRTAELHLNVVAILETGTMKIGLTGPIKVENGVLTVSIKLTHPFTGKLQFSGFDCKGILISTGSEAGFNDPDIKIAGPNETRLLNADGFTRWWNPAEFLNKAPNGFISGKLGIPIDPAKSAILNGYKLYADDFEATDKMIDLDTATRAMFKAGSANTREFQISLASGLKFNYAVDCSWAKPNPCPPVNLPGDFPSEANQAEPWFIQTIETQNTLWFENSEHGGDLALDVLIHDWQGTGDLIKDDILVESPGVFSMIPDSLVVIDANTVMCHLDITQPIINSADPIDILVSVTDPGNYTPAQTGVDKALKAYFRHIASVMDKEPIGNEPPVALMHATTPTDIYEGQSVSFDGTESYDPDGTITEYIWDFDGDGVFGEEPYDGDPTTPTRTFDTVGTYQVQLKVTDNLGDSDTSDPVTVNVQTNPPPVAIAEATTATTIDEGGTVSFDGSGSYDIDGSVVNWEWDFNGDGVYGDAFDGTMQEPTASFPDPGIFDVDLKVTDNLGASGTLSQKIPVTVNDLLTPPSAVAEATTPTDIEACQTVEFDASGSTDTDGIVEQYLWDFNGDGTFGDSFDGGTDVNPVESFPSSGSWDVRLKVIDDDGLEDILSSPIVVNVTNILPIASAVATTPTNIMSGDSVSFDATGSSDPDCDSIVSYEWDFDGDEIYGDSYDSGSDEEPTKVFPAKGTFQVSLKVTDSNGDSDTIDDPITVIVSNHPPIACAEITSTPPYFQDTDIDFSADCSTDPDGTIVSYEWDLGADGSFEKTGMNVSFNFDEVGIYEVQLKVTDNVAASDMLTDPITFEIVGGSNTPPEITKMIRSRTTSEKANPDEKVSLSVEFTDPLPIGDTHTYLWTCAYGSFDDPTSATPIWTPPDQIIKCDITVRVTDAGGLWDEGTCKQWVTQYAAITNSINPSPDKTMIPSLSMDTADNGFIDPTSYKYADTEPDGNVIYVHFWASWDPYCIMEMPVVDGLYSMYDGQDYVHLNVSVGENKTAVQGWLANNPSHLATHWAIDSTTTYWGIFSVGWGGGANYLPHHYIFDRDGRLRGKKIGSITSSGIGVLTPYIDELI